MQFEQLPNLVVFLKIVEKGSLSAAAQALGLPRSSMSKKLAQLEQSLGQRLLQRNTRYLALTEWGSELLRETEALSTLLTNVEALQEKHQQQPQGLLTVSCAVCFGRQYIVPLLADFQQEYPLIDLHLRLEDKVIDIVKEKVDLAIRIGHLPDSSLVAQRMGFKQWVWACSPSYQARYGIPQHPSDLSRFPCVTYKNDHIHFNEWLYQGADQEPQMVRVLSRMCCNDADALVTLACHGMGVLMIDKNLIRQQLANGELQQILTEFSNPDSMPIYVVYPSREGLAAKTRVFKDYLMQRLVMLQ